MSKPSALTTSPISSHCPSPWSGTFNSTRCCRPSSSDEDWPGHALRSTYRRFDEVFKQRLKTMPRRN